MSAYDPKRTIDEICISAFWGETVSVVGSGIFLIGWEGYGNLAE